MQTDKRVQECLGWVTLGAGRDDGDAGVSGCWRFQRCRLHRHIQLLAIVAPPPAADITLHAHSDALDDLEDG